MFLSGKRGKDEAPKDGSQKITDDNGKRIKEKSH
jgi:hypothetical protein